MQTETFSTGGLQITPENRLLLEAEISTNVGTIHSIEYNDPIAITIVEELDMNARLTLYNIVTSYLIYRDPEDIKNQMCTTIDGLTLTELQILETITENIHNRDPLISLRRKLCAIYKNASPEEVTLYDTEFQNLNLY